jgi:type VI secretion system protein ImpL
VSVAVNLKRISSTDTSAGDAQASQGFRGLRLPDAIVGRAGAGAGPALAGATQ